MLVVVKSSLAPELLLGSNFRSMGLLARQVATGTTKDTV